VSHEILHPRVIGEDNDGYDESIRIGNSPYGGSLGPIRSAE